MLTRSRIGPSPGCLGTGEPHLSHGVPHATRRECVGVPGCERSSAHHEYLRRLRADCTAVWQGQAVDGVLREQCSGHRPTPTVRRSDLLGIGTGSHSPDRRLSATFSQRNLWCRW